MPLEILLGGVIASALIWVTGSALSRMWAAHKQLVEKVEALTMRITRLEALTIGKDATPGGDQ